MRLVLEQLRCPFWAGVASLLPLAVPGAGGAQGLQGEPRGLRGEPGGLRGEPGGLRGVCPWHQDPCAALHTSRTNLGGAVKYGMPAKQMILERNGVSTSSWLESGFQTNKTLNSVSAFG